MAILINVVLPVFLVVGAAVIAHARLRFHAQTLSRVAFYLFTPFLVFDSLISSDTSGAELGQIAAVALLTAAVVWLLGAILARPLKLEGATKAAFLVALLYMNAGNYGLSVNLFAFGEPGLARASLFFTVNSVLCASLGVFLSARGKAPVGLALRRVAAVPLVYAAVAGLVFNLAHIAVPEPLAKASHLLGQAAVPTMLTVLGLRLVETFQGKLNAVHIPALGVVTVVRLVIAPTIAFGFATLLGMQGLTRNVTIMESAMPTAVITTILASEFESDTSFAALSVLVTTLASLLTVTIWLNLLAGG